MRKKQDKTKFELCFAKTMKEFPNHILQCSACRQIFAGMIAHCFITNQEIMEK